VGKSEIQYAKGSTHLVIKGTKNRWGAWFLGGFHTRKTKPDVARDEIALSLSLKLQAALFKTPAVGIHQCRRRRAPTPPIAEIGRSMYKPQSSESGSDECHHVSVRSQARAIEAC